MHRSQEERKINESKLWCILGQSYYIFDSSKQNYNSRFKRTLYSKCNKFYTKNHFNFDDSSYEINVNVSV